jgi:hypothetical protein
MPWASNRIANDDSFGKRSAVVCAGSRYGEHIAALTHQGNRFAFMVSEERLVFDEFAEFDARLKIGARQYVSYGHFIDTYAPEGT